MLRRILFFLISLLLIINVSCNNSSLLSDNINDSLIHPALSAKQTLRSKNNSHSITIHVFVALCDNKYQGIVPVPAAIGNGQDANSNLYWGTANGVKSYFRKSNDWKLVKSFSYPSNNIIERLLFKHKQKNIYLLADGYDGRFIKQATIDFLNSASGNFDTYINYDKDTICFGGKSELISYVGHDGLMDFSINEQFTPTNIDRRKAIVLACYSKTYFAPFIKSSGADPLLWTRGLMAPEAYTLHDAIGSWINNQKPEEIRMAAAKAYSKYQKCSIKAAMNLFASGW